MTTRNESNPSRMVRETVRGMCLAFFAALVGAAAGAVVFGLGLLIGVQATVGVVCGLGLTSALVLFRDYLGA